MLSMRAKLIMAACAAAIWAVVAVGWINHSQIAQASLREAEESLRDQARLVLWRTEDALKEMEQDARLISALAPVQGLMDLAEANPTPADVERLRADWRGQLEAAFAAVMAGRTHYTQVRLIGVDDDGRELARVDRKGEALVPVPENELQSKASEPYFARALGARPGEVIFSDVTYNREHGRITEDRVRTLRLLQPLFLPDGSMFGFLAVNSDYTRMLAGALRRMEPDRDTVLLGDGGDWAEIRHDPMLERGVAVRAGHISDGDLPDSLTRALSNPDATFLEVGDTVYGRARALSGGDADGLALTAIVAAPRREVLAPARDAARSSLVVVLALSLTAVAATAAVMAQTSRTMKALAHALRRIDERQGGGLKEAVKRRDEVGEVARAISAMLDRMRLGEAKAQAVIDNMVDAIIVIDAKGLIEDFSPSAERLFGYRAEHVLGRNVKMLMPAPHEAAHDGHLERFRRTGERRITGQGREVTGLRRDGSTFPAELSVGRVPLDGRVLFSGAVRDVTERKRSEAIKNEFISTVNHELRTPLTSIRGSLVMLERHASDSLNPRGARLLELALRGCERLHRLVDDILDLEKISAGRMSYRIERLELNALVRDIVSRHEGLADSYGVSFAVEAEGPDLRVGVDAGRFNQALVNLLSNAAKFSPPGEAVEVRVIAKEDGWARVTVADRGPGIPESFRDQVFERFSQAGRSGGRGEGGSGLGLSITRDLIHAFGGEVSFETVTGAGTAFHFDLPEMSDAAVEELNRALGEGGRGEASKENADAPPHDRADDSRPMSSAGIAAAARAAAARDLAAERGAFPPPAASAARRRAASDGA